MIFRVQAAMNKCARVFPSLFKGGPCLSSTDFEMYCQTPDADFDNVLTDTISLGANNC
jgi:hypothetical protein